MKTQFSFRKYGFTLVELMIVISIIMYIFYQFSRISFLPREDVAKAERLANKVASVLHEGLMNVSIGRMDATKQAVTGATISFSTSTGIYWKYTTVMTGSFAPPYYDADLKYEIRDITWTGGRSPGAVSGTSTGFTIIIDNNRSIFTGTTLNATATVVTIRTRYRNMNKKVVFDRRTGRIEVNKE
ncbi:prepilin-type N-terminal cleavage/methylation domain-containing protein [Candidatus Gracilibacteria bacterium]|nr:prepilin-type N-terminal cleavage/methylation domain-containing protein [Candidatus Gracilibacteria bacterium]